MADYYVDFSATNDGDGTTHSQAGSPGGAGAYNTLASKTFTTGDKVWIRRVTRSSDYSADISFANSGVIYIGWPKSGDAYYATRPSGAQASWDGDGGDYGEFSFNSSSFELNITANTVEMHRIKVNQKATNGDVITFGTSINNFKAYKCYFINSHASGVAATSLFSLSNGQDDHIYNGCIFETTAFTPTGSTGLLTIGGQRTTIIGCTITVTSAAPTSAGTNAIFNVTAGNCAISDNTINIGTLSGSFGIIAIYANGGSITGSFFVNNTFTVTTHTATVSEFAVQITNHGVTVRGFYCNFGKGISISGSGNIVEAINLVQRHASTTGSILISSGCYGNEIHIVNMTFITGNTTGDVVVNGENNVVYLRNCAYSSTPVTVSGGSLNRWYSFDHNQVIGNFLHGSKGGTVISSNTTRDTGESFSLKYEMNGVVSLSKGELALSRRGSETIWLSLSSGANTVTLFGAYKNFTTLNAHDIWAELEYVNGSDNTVILSTRVVDGALTSDTSTWTGDTGLTKFKLVLSVTLPSDQVVPIRLFGLKYEAGAYLYIDPKPVIT